MTQSSQFPTIVHAYWADHLGCPPDRLFAHRFDLLTHAGELVDYVGAFALFRNDAATGSIPPDRINDLQPLLTPLTNGATPEQFATALSPVATRVIGPAWIGYAEQEIEPRHPVHSLESGDQPKLDQLRESCDSTEWDHGGSALDQPCSGILIDGQLVALAGYEVWGGTIAHISVITHPEFRSHGFAQSAVAHLAARAIKAGLLPQYRTLQANLPSIRIAEALGFEAYATSMAVRF